MGLFGKDKEEDIGIEPDEEVVEEEPEEEEPEDEKTYTINMSTENENYVLEEEVSEKDLNAKMSEIHDALENDKGFFFHRTIIFTPPSVIGQRKMPDKVIAEARYLFQVLWHCPYP